jgi:hypothetical protein
VWPFPKSGQAIKRNVTFSRSGRALARLPALPVCRSPVAGLRSHQLKIARQKSRRKRRAKSRVQKSRTKKTRSPNRARFDKPNFAEHLKFFLDLPIGFM